jgi:hypothetical protein
MTTRAPDGPGWLTDEDEFAYASHTERDTTRRGKSPSSRASLERRRRRARQHGWQAQTIAATCGPVTLRRFSWEAADAR